MNSLVLSCTSLLVLIACTAVVPHSIAQSAKKPLQVFILAGQSNMDGHAKISSFDHIGMDPRTAPILSEMRGDDGAPRVCERVWISYFQGPGADAEGHGKLTAGFGARTDPRRDGGKIGPEFTFGIYMQKLIDEPILIIKTGWGGKSLHTDFRPPSAGPFEFNAKPLDRIASRGADLQQAKKEQAAATGRFYRLLVEHVQRVLSDPQKYCPAYDAEHGYELAGFVWFQGWNDMVDPGVYPHRDKTGGYDSYSQLLAHFIRDIRADLSAPNLPFVIGVMGVGGPVKNYSGSALRYQGIHDNFRRAMAAPAEMPEFRSNVKAVLTEDYWDPELDAVAKKRNLVNAKAKSLREANQGFPDTPGTLSPEAQEEALAEYRESLFSPRDLELQKGITNAEFHYLGSAKIMAQIGKAFAEAVHDLSPRRD